MYRERPSCGGRLTVWTRTGTTGGEARVLPDGCMDLIWARGELVVAGPDTRAHVVVDAPGERYAAIRCAPGVGPALFGVPAVELRDRRVALGDVWTESAAREIAERATAAADPGAYLEGLAVERLRAGDPIADRLTADVIAGLRAGNDVAAVADAVGLSERQLHRRALVAFGYGPKTLSRILRLDRALTRARTGTALADVAAATGYADQAHLARDVKALAGVPLTTLLSPGA